MIYKGRILSTWKSKRLEYTGIYDTGSGKIHHRNKMAEPVDIIF